MAQGPSFLPSPFIENEGSTPYSSITGFAFASLEGPILLTREPKTAECAMACQNLTHYFKDQVLHPNTAPYGDFRTNYWAAQQQALAPACVFSPADASQVAYLVRLSQGTNWPFAVKSGGHGAFAGPSNIENGIAVSLKRLNEIAVSDDLSLVEIGVGNNWMTVYEKLEEYRLAVAGGRYPSVGVGGLSLGGGQSFFATTQGLTYLHWALRGGGNNFGIVTKITMETISLTECKMWGGVRVYTENKFSELLQAADNLGNLVSDDGAKSAQIINFSFLEAIKIAAAVLTHSDPERRPAAMSEYLSIPALADTTRVRSLTDMTADLASLERALPGSDDSIILKARGTATFSLNTDILAFAKDTCFDEFDKIADIEGVKPMCVFQIITKGQLEATVAKGGNAMGLDPEEGPLFLLNTQAGWTEDSDSDSSRVKQALQSVIKRTSTYAKERGWGKEFQYMNYAGEFQDIIAGYGEDNKRELVTIADRYDPEAVFQRLQPNYFKLVGAPVNNSF
ncbi:hypothetical protein AJ79_10125 [Helicocarpus griseus UAMH5409]|uniref:FAD-binding PCMH-type domain-containing protein n=1 Tax=Helicocarpus griseus UAMH5409 TaxID=1447875 RepID=A0A2B7WFT6_9EURO|nr:hypothetical protein AJ79_10125 [Helicocarpus griseus UAMH5409]